VITLALWFAFACVGVAMLATAWRLLRGPVAVDRVLALDTLYVLVVALVVLLGLVQGSELLFEAALLVALLGFVSTVALARYLARGDVME
jgi:multicomponent K+:H+ antiporter subunit F